MTTRAPLLRLSDLATTPSESVGSFLEANADGSSLGFFDSGRAALYRGLVSHLGENPSGTALLPSYICHSAVVPFRAAGLDVAYYDVTRSTETDPGSVESRMTDDTVAAMSVDYFGFPARGFEALERVCERADLLHVEDNAHSVLSRSGSTLLGTRADFGVSSLHKVLPVPDGGVLFASDAEPNGAVRKTTLTELDFVLRNGLKTVDSRLFDGSVVQSINDLLDDSGLDEDFEVGGMSPLTNNVLKRVDSTDVIDRRRQNYRTLSELVADEPGVEALYHRLEEGVCPQVFPVVAEYPSRFIRRLRSVNVPVHRWPNLPPAVRGNDAFADANYLAEHVLTIPIHQTCPADAVPGKIRSLRSGRRDASSVTNPRRGSLR